MINWYIFSKTEFIKETRKRREPKLNIDFKELKLNFNEGFQEQKYHKNTVENSSLPTIRATKLQTPTSFNAKVTLSAPDKVDAKTLTLNCVLKSSDLLSNVL